MRWITIPSAAGSLSLNPFTIILNEIQMKMNFIKLAAIPVILLGLLPSCTKNADGVLQDNSDFSNAALAQVFVATMNASRNYVYVDGFPVNGSVMTTGSLFPASGPGFKVAPGIKAFLVRDTITTTTQVPLAFAENFQFGKTYTVFLYDTITSPKQKTVQTDIVVPTDTTARLRFANFVYNPNAIPAVDVFSFRLNKNIFTNVNVTDVTGFIPYPSALSPDTLYIRNTGTTTNLMKISMTNLAQKRNYTMVYRGSDRGTRASTLFINR